MANIWEKAITILAGDLNSGLSYLITAVQKKSLIWSKNANFKLKFYFCFLFQALERFSPEERDCYQENEIDLLYLPKSHGYRYEMSNCLFEAAYEQILEQCRCAPG